MSLDLKSMDKRNAYQYIFFYKIIDDELYTIVPDHLVRTDLPPVVSIDTGYIELDGETFKLVREAV